MDNFIISIDGTAGSGKERIAKYIAQKYRLFHLDSGILYRRVAYKLMKNKINYSDTKNLSEFIGSLDFLNHKSHKSLRTEKISHITSQIAKSANIREFVNKNQRFIVNNKLKFYRGCVIDGRDIGSKVFKKAKIKLFINVKAEIRAKRRHKQLIELGEKSIYAQILKEINLRDNTDKNRNESPLIVPPKGAIVIDNSMKI